MSSRCCSLVLADGDVRMAEIVEGIGLGGAAEDTEQSDGPLVVADGLLVVPGAVGDMAQTVQGVRRTIGVLVRSVADAAGLAVGAGSLVVGD